ncbi:hypothetical protein F3K34_44330 [Streptomyces sp. LBUM 1486]|uniref:hypothetical protein n=1 Tax=Streptomyces scabiei TaxID=1930 RepID=UPI001B336211|nr:hypothetical protein [Streptomyces sp. LBUM 1486]MBP5918808.1 hypothetical protein [Streptomyces sp. LBUM 1486]
MSGAKKLPPPGGGKDIEALLRRRRVRTDDEQAQPEAAPDPEPVPEKPADRQRSGMDRRSWYMARASADALAAAVEDLHYETRNPKHVVLSELVAVALEHREEVAERLRKR